MKPYRVRAVLAILFSALCLVGVALHCLTLSRSKHIHIRSWWPFVVGAAFALPTIMLGIPRLWSGFLKHALRALAAAVLVGPIVGPPEGDWMPCWVVLMGVPSYLVLGPVLNVQFFLGAYLVFVSAFLGSLGADWWKVSTRAAPLDGKLPDTPDGLAR